MTFQNTYFSFVQTTLQNVFKENEIAMENAAQMLLACSQQQGRIYTFGTGHSHMIGQDLYARAGGYACVYPIVEIELTLATHPTKSTHIERCASYADVLEQVYHIHPNDIIIATSNSGRNPLVIEYLLRCIQKGAKVICITSLTHSKQIESRHISGKRLYEISDVVLDNMAPYGDAGVDIDAQTRMGPISTLTGCFLAQSVIGRFVELCIENKLEAPVFKSSNMDGADAYNQALFDSYILK